VPRVFAWFAAGTVVALAVLLVAEWREARAGVWIAKPLAAAGFVGAALAQGALATPYGRLVLGGLVLSWVGDVLLIPRGARRAFLAGLGSFLLAHLAYTIAFAVRGLDLRSTAFAAVPVAAAGLLALRHLWPHVQENAPRLQRPVLAYLAVISTMVVTAFGTAGAAPSALIWAGATAFYASDLAVARQRFVAPAFSNKLWGLPLYFAAQLALAASVG
jgi:uncharacterized membrane protein YhhN